MMVDVDAREKESVVNQDAGGRGTASVAVVRRGRIINPFRGCFPPAPRLRARAAYRYGRVPIVG